jgi:hypothetical protein
MDRPGYTIFVSRKLGEVTFRNNTSADIRPPRKLDEYTVYGRIDCPYSERAFYTLLDLIAKQKIGSFVYWNVTDPVLRQIARGFAPASHNTVPIVFNFDKFVGGNEELQRKLTADGKFITEEKKQY